MRLSWTRRLKPLHPAALLAAALCVGQPAQAEPLFYSSVTSNDIDYITRADASALACVTYQGTARREMPDRRREVLFADGVHVFEARYRDGKHLELWAHPDFDDRSAAARTVAPVAEAIGRLPAFMRLRLNHVVLHVGPEEQTAFAEDAGRFFVLYSGNVARRIADNDLEETVFHEAVHATLDIPHATARAWRRAQARDGAFLTGYAAERPDKEDLAETMLIAFTALRHPARLPPEVLRAVQEKTPNRLAYIARLLQKSDTGASAYHTDPLCP